MSQLLRLQHQCTTDLTQPLSPMLPALSIPVCAANKQSLEVDWRHMHLMPGMRPVAAACADAPREVLRLLDVAAAEAVFDAYPEYESIHQDIHVRITGLPVDDSIRDLRCGGCVIGVMGTVFGHMVYMKCVWGVGGGRA